MDKVYSHKTVEEKIYQTWEEKGYFKPEINPNGKPYCIMLPLPNANGALHLGHGMFTVEDILIRYHRMMGDSTLWFPGTDHAGIETQFVFENKLRAEGKSRLDFDQETLYKMIWDYVEENRGNIEKQLRRLGLSLDWSREKYPLNPEIVKLVYQTFKKMFDDGYAYRGYRLVNYCTFDGTSFSDLEVNYEEKNSKLYFIKYPVINEKAFITVATTRPETLFGDTAVAVNPKDKRYADLVGKRVSLPLTDRQILIISDESVDMKFGTGAVKVTPAHDPKDYELGMKHNLEQITVIGFDGKMTGEAGEFKGLYGKQARTKVAEKLTELGLLEKENDIVHQVPVCYKCKNVIEPLLLDQWFIKVKPLAEPAIKAVREGTIKIYPKSFEKIYFQWMENLRDWNISRQIVWGIRIPAWKNKKTGEWIVTEGNPPDGEDWEQDKDTFDTWFSSGQWPFVTLKTAGKGDFEKFYPTSVLETAADILKAWVSRMIMLGIYMTGEIPFRDVLLHGMVTDPYGKKMSKSKGNVVNPLELIDQYGADAVRFALIFGNATGSDQALSYPKLEAMRKFSNKLWNMGRFIEMQFNQEAFKGKKLPFYSKEMDQKLAKEDLEIIKETDELIKRVTESLNSYRFHDGAGYLYDFIWHRLADVYIEQIKERLNNGDDNALTVLRHVWITCLKLLHPFMPFITEELWGKLPKLTETELIISQWPQ